jgi:hypothetical protein
VALAEIVSKDLYFFYFFFADANLGFPATPNGAPNEVLLPANQLDSKT